ncbi:MAG: aminotransferase class V-fold PLP-dependent enzyme [Candidatus Saccharimonadales bacterium]|jgi:cysteine desulfurase/selenocysteine lyase
MSIFHAPKQTSKHVKDFDYLADEAFYFDSACQTLRPQQVIDAVNEYYHEYNACGDRVKYEWGLKVDEKIRTTRQNLLVLAGKSDRDYACAFTLNTTYGINLLLSQLPAKTYERIVTSEIEHNSVFLPSMTWAKRFGIERLVLGRGPDGSLIYSTKDLDKGMVVVNTTTNVNGVNLINAAELANDVHHAGGIVMLDGAQTMGHNPESIKNVDFDGLCFSGHKMYGPSLGVIIIKRKLLDALDLSFIGGGTVEDVQKDSYTLLRGEPESHLEAGLQNFSGIIGLNAAVEWQKNYRPEGKKPQQHEEFLANKLFAGLKAMPSVQLFNQAPSSIISFHSNKIDAHKLAIYLSAEGVMARSGYFCCHYWLDVKSHLPPLLRLSLGLNNTEAQVDKLLNTLSAIIGGR